MPELAKRIGKNEDVLDVACGFALLAGVLHHLGHQGLYVGVDFSKVQIDRAVAHCPHPLAIYVLEDITQGDLFGCFQKGVVVMAEILEHLPDDGDVELLKSIQSGRRILITVPTTDDESHVRVFSRGGEDVIERYSPLMDIKDHMIMDGSRRYWQMLDKVKRKKVVVPIFYHILEGTRK
jgi:SAM-dependent methyltransferase